MSIINYFFIGILFSCMVDIVTYFTRNDPKVKEFLENGDWGLIERILCILIWPLAALTFFSAFFKTYFKK
jgi:mannose/fructose/N-acetylgalactosamine-specific phosphotransferase system component IIC